LIGSADGLYGKTRGKGVTVSSSLLKDLNAGQNGLFRKWLDSNATPRLAWYPSSGRDLRDVLYLSRAYENRNPSVGKRDQLPPDLFIHTDYQSWGRRFSEVLHADRFTKIVATEIEELPNCKLPLSKELVAFPKGDRMTGRVFFANLSIRSLQLGCFTARLLYVFAENVAFFGEKILPNLGNIETVIHIRHGGGCGGGGMANGSWLAGSLACMSSKLLITDGIREPQSGDIYAMERYPILAEYPSPRLEGVRSIPGVSWSNYGKTVEFKSVLDFGRKYSNRSSAA